MDSQRPCPEVASLYAAIFVYMVFPPYLTSSSLYTYYLIYSIGTPHFALHFNSTFRCQLRSYPKTVKYGGDAVPIPGANFILEHLSLLQVPWGIVTSGTKPLATGWLAILQLAHPSALIIADAVQNGKPDPA